MWIPVEPLNFNVEASTRDLHDHEQDQSGSNEPSDSTDSSNSDDNPLDVLSSPVS